MRPVSPLRLTVEQREFFATPRTWTEILATRWYTSYAWTRLILQEEDTGALYWDRKRKVWAMQKRHDTDKVPVAEIRKHLAEHEPMVECECGAEIACPRCKGLGAVPVSSPPASAPQRRSA